MESIMNKLKEMCDKDDSSVVDLYGNSRGLKPRAQHQAQCLTRMKSIAF